MSSRSDELPRDDELSALYRQGANREPPPALDAIIIAAAHRKAAVQPPRAPKPRRSAWWRSWLAPAGAIATVVLALSVTLNIDREQRQPLPASAPLATPAPAPVPAAIPEPPARVANDAPAAMSVAPSRAAPAVQLEEARMRASMSAEAASPPSAILHALPAPAPLEASVAAPQAKPFPAEPLPSASPAATHDYSGSAPDTAKAVPAPVARPAAVSPVQSEAASPEVHAKGESSIRAPEPWLADIRRLKAAGELQSAQAQLQAFRRQYPDYPLPEDLRGD